MARKQSFNYFNGFVDLAEFACQSAVLVDIILNDFSQEQLPQQMEKIHELEHAADEKNHDIFHALAKEFIPPLEIEDISAISHRLDDVVDCIEDIVIKLYAYNVKKIHPAAIQFSKIIVRCCEKLKEATQEFAHYKKNENLKNSIIEVNRLESEGDELYTSAMHELHSGKTDIAEVLVWSRMLDGMEKVCDMTESVSNLLYGTVMKNS